MTDTLADALPREIDRIRAKRDRWIKMASDYPEIAAGVNITIALMQHQIGVAVRAASEGDVASMAGSLESLRAYSHDD